MEPSTTQDSASTHKSDESPYGGEPAQNAPMTGASDPGEVQSKTETYKPAFTTSVYDANRGWTDRRPLHRRAEAVLVQCGNFKVYVYMVTGHHAADFKPFGVRVLDATNEDVISHTLMTAGGVLLSTDEAEDVSARMVDEKE